MQKAKLDEIASEPASPAGDDKVRGILPRLPMDGFDIAAADTTFAKQRSGSRARARTNTLLERALFEVRSDPQAREMGLNMLAEPVGGTGPVIREGAGQWRPVLALALLTLIWGFSIPVMKLGLAALSPLALVSLRYVGAAPFFALFLIGRRLPSPRALGAMAGLAALGLGAGQVLQVLGVQRTSAAAATIILATIPIFTVVLAVLRLRQTLRPHHVAGLMLAVGGIGLTTVSATGGGAMLSPAALTGDGCLLLSSVCIAAYYVLGAELAIGQGVMVVSAWTTIFGAALLLPAAVWAIAHHDVRFSLLGIGTLAYLSLLVTVLGIWIWLHALHALPARIAASSQYMQPLIGVLASAAIFGTPLGGGFVFGSAMVLGGVVLCGLSAARKD